MNKKNLEQKIDFLEKELRSLKSREAKKESLRRKTLRFSIVTSLLGVSLYTFASVIASLHIFSDGEIISAKKINENFEYLNNKISQVSSGGTVSENVSTFATISLGTNQNGNLYMVHDTAEFLLPDISSVPVGFNLQFSIKEKGQARLVLNGLDRFESNLIEDIMVLSPMMGNGSGYFHILNTGSAWIIKVQSNGTYMGVESSKIYTAFNCSGKGSDPNTNCYLNSTATNIGLFGYTVFENKILQYMSPNWQVLNTNDYLINDQSNLLPTLNYTSSFDFNSGTLGMPNSLVYIALTSSSHNINSIFDYDSSFYNHVGTNDADYINNTVTTNLVDSSINTGFRGQGCQGKLGEDWRFMTETEALAELINISNQYWISGSTGMANGYKHMDMSGTSVLTTTDTSMLYLKLVCVYDPI